jgi:predicted ribosomally synthesized peptide with nif11-like leader
MSVKDAKSFVKKLQTDKEFSEMFQKTGESKRDEFVKKAGFRFTMDELKKVVQSLSDEELSTVSGGNTGSESREKCKKKAPCTSKEPCRCWTWGYGCAVLG